MASIKFMFLTLVLSFIILSIFSDSVVGQEQRKSRSRSSKKKKISTRTSTSTTPLPSVTEEVTTIPSEVLQTPPLPASGSVESNLTGVGSLGVDNDNESVTASDISDPLLITTTTISVEPAPDSDSDTEITTTTSKIERTTNRKSKTKKPVVVRNVLVSTGGGSGSGTNKSIVGCYECDREECPSIDRKSCPTGLVKDRCDCCDVCGAGEGNRCWDSSLNLRFNADIGKCGHNLSCKLRTDLEPFDPPEALCECNEKRVVCGSDNVTYASECRLREAAHSNPDLVIASRLPCVSPPWITHAVENATVSSGDEVALSCEVKGYPAAVIHWEFIEDNPQSTFQILPGDDSSIVIVVRGGPEPQSTTSWIQMINVTPSRAGRYFCVAKNSEGSIQSTGFVSVQKND